MPLPCKEVALKRQQRPSDEKLRELILYLSDLSAQDRHFGAVKLNKLLFYADVLAYQRHGEAITGQEYQALPQGPAPRRLKPVTDKMKKMGELRTQEVRINRRFRQLRPIAGRMPNLSKFTKQENDLILEVVQRFWNLNAKQISEESHLFLGWQLANEGETIPYSTVLIGNRKPTEAERRKGHALQKLAKEALAGDHR
jgi:antitoxin SocA-like protein